MRYLPIILALSLLAGCDFLESDNNTFPDAKTQMRVINSTNMSLTVGIETGEHNSTTLDISGSSNTDFPELTAGPSNIYIIADSDTLSELTDKYLEFGYPSSLYVFGDTTVSYQALFLEHKKTYSETSSYVRFINAIYTVPAVDIYLSDEEYYEENDSLYYSDNGTFIGKTIPFLSSVNFGDGNLSYNDFISNGKLSVIVTKVGKPDSVLVANRIENSAQESKTVLISETELTPYIDQF